ncbi:MAG: ABC transporter ATP-binding protein [Chlorobiaceae bacterium]|nr:ABC transporter ATP-binding protein [Chlorobiaceae bacterium]
MSGAREALVLSGISKRFGAIEANRNVSFSVLKGSIHAIAGENGAGKSTLARLIFGLYKPDSGTIAVNGKAVSMSAPGDAIAAGIGMVHQHFMLVPSLTVAENVMLGVEGRRLFSPISAKNTADEIRSLSEQYGLPVDPEALTGKLSVGEEQRVEILKVLYRKADILIFDEPTAVLTPQETDRLFSILRTLCRHGKTILIITHKLDEVLSLADRVSVMRKGEVTGTVECETTSKEELARMMVGRNVLLRVDNPTPSPGKPLLVVENISCITENGVLKLDNLNFLVRSGEIFGIAGVDGNGQSELLSLLWGLRSGKSRISGTIRINDIDIIGKSPAAIASLGVSHIPEDRLKHAVIGSFSIRENLLFGRHRERRFKKGIGFDRKNVSVYANRLREQYDIRCDDIDKQSIGSLSGGNQQKVVAARELDRPGLRLLILAQPTRGVDIGAIETIHRSIIKARNEGIAILLISSELDELIALSTRIGCLYNGSFRRIFTEEDVAKGRCDEQAFEHEIGLHIT